VPERIVTGHGATLKVETKLRRVTESEIEACLDARYVAPSHHSHDCWAFVDADRRTKVQSETAERQRMTADSTMGEPSDPMKVRDVLRMLTAASNSSSHEIPA
jgi:hypothetical protein